MATIYTRVECKWDGVTQEYVVNEKQGFEYNGPILFAKKKFKKILGIVATIAIAVFAPAALGISQTMAGALGGAVGGYISGGGRGAILGAITGGIGGYGVENGWWGGAGATGLEGNSGGANFVGPPGELAGSGVASFAGPPVELAGSGTGAAIEGSSAVVSGTDNVGTPIGTDAVGGQSGTTFDQAAIGQQQGAGLNADGNYSAYPDDLTALQNEQYGAGTGASAPVAANGGTQPGFFDNMSPTLQKAGLELGKQALGSFLTGATEPSYMKDYASTMKDVSDRNMQISDYNMSMANKKAAVGDQLYGDANAMSPDYFAEQQRRQRQTMDANAWGDAEQRLRAQGKDDNYINNERRRFDIATSQNQGTMYDFGWQAGMNARNNTFSTAGGMYGGVGYMGDPTGGMYQSYAQANQQRASGIGRGIDAVFNADKQNQTGTENTRDKDKNMGVANSFGGK